MNRTLKGIAGLGFLVTLGFGPNVGAQMPPVPGTDVGVRAVTITQADTYVPHTCDACDADNASGSGGSGFFLDSQCSAAGDGTGRMVLTFTNKEPLGVEATVNGETKLATAKGTAGAKVTFYVPFSGPSVTITRSAQRIDGKVIIAKKTRVYPCPCTITVATTVPVSSTVPPTVSTTPGTPTSTPPAGPSVPGATTPRGTVVGGYTLPATGSDLAANLAAGGAVVVFLGILALLVTRRGRAIQ